MKSGRQDYLIRPASHRDLPAVVRLWRELQEINAVFDPRLTLNTSAMEWFERYLGEQMDNTSAAVLVAEQDQLVVGYIFGHIMRRPTLISGDCGYIVDLSVSAPLRGRGIGRSLHNRLRAWFLAQEITAVEVQIIRANPASQAFWRKMGYQEFLRTLRSE